MRRQHDVAAVQQARIDRGLALEHVQPGRGQAPGLQRVGQRVLVDAAALARMKPTASLTSIARGGLIDEDALADALQAGRLAAAGLDVFEGEPAVNPRLLDCRSVVLTPHIASASLPTRRAMVTLAVDNLIAAMGFGPDAGRPPSPLTG